MNDIATKDCFDWVSHVPNMVQALARILRLLDDLQTYEVNISHSQLKKCDII